MIQGPIAAARGSILPTSGVAGGPARHAVAQRSWWRRQRERIRGGAEGGPSLSGGVSAGGLVSGRHGGEVVAVELGEVVAHHQ